MQHDLRAPLAVYMLADHLDGALAAGEDLRARGYDWRALAEKPGDPLDFAISQRKIAEDVRALEMALIARVLKARGHARALAGIDIRFRPIADLFVSATVLLVDAAEECGDARSEDFDTGEDLVAYVRSRGLIAPDAPAVRAPSDLLIDDSFLVAKRIALGPLLDMSAAFLDALDVQYELFVEDVPATKARLSIDSEENPRAPLH